MNLPPFEGLAQRLAADFERTERMIRAAEPFGERMARELERADRLTREMAQTDAFMHQGELAERMASQLATTEAFTREIELSEQLARESNAAVPRAIETAMRETDRAMQAAKVHADLVGNFSASLPDLVSLSSAAAGKTIEEFQTRSTELGKFASELAKPIKLPSDWAENLVYSRPDYVASLPKFELPKGCTLAKLQRMSDNQIRDFLGGNVSFKATQLALHELAQRRLDRISSKITRVEATIKKVDQQNIRTQRLVIVLAIIAIAVGALQCVIAWIK